jgi:hypothetical protein
MTNNQHPITPPPELVSKWINEYLNEHPEGVNVEVLVVNAAQWGADQELEACCEWLDGVGDLTLQLRADRRPKPPSLKEQALEALRHAPGPDYPNPIRLLTADEHALIRRALEQLDD